MLYPTNLPVGKSSFYIILNYDNSKDYKLRANLHMDFHNIKIVFFFLIISFCHLSLGINNAVGAPYPNSSKKITIYYTISTILEDQDGKPTYNKIIIDHLKTVFSKNDINFTFTATSWNRIMKQASKEENALIFDIIKTKKREKLFHWLTPVFPDNNPTFLFARNDKKLLKLTRQQIIDGPYTSVCSQLSVQCDYLLEFGFSKEKIITIIETKSTMLETFVLRGRADFFALKKGPLNENLIKLADQQIIPSLTNKPDIFVPMFKLASNPSYLAAPRSINPDLLVKLKAVFKNFPLQDADQ